jgi:hypothetical protein
VRRLGFELITLKGYDHIGASSATDDLVPKLTPELAAAGSR